MPLSKRSGLANASVAIGMGTVAFGAMMIAPGAGQAAILTPAIGTTTMGGIAGGFPAGLPGGDTLVAAETMPFTGTSSPSNATVFTGSVTSYVFLDPSEPAALGGGPGYDFVYQLTNTPDNQTPDDSIDRITFANFASSVVASVPTVDVNYLISTGDTAMNVSGDVAPTTADDSNAGKTIGFNFGNLVAPGQTSDYLLIQTAANTYVQGTASVIDGGTGTTGAEAPEAVVIFSVPEPATFGVIAVVGGILLGRRRR